MKKKRVLHLLASNSYSGAENVVCTIIENETDNYEMFYCSYDGDIRNILKEKHIKFIPYQKLNVRNIRKIVKDYHIDIIHAHDFKASFIAALINFDGKIISHIHCNPSFLKSWNLFSIIYYCVSKKFNSIIFVSQECINGTVFMNKIKNKSFVIHNAISLNKVKEKSLMNQKFKSDLVFLGRFIDLKNPKLVIEITNILKKSLPNIKVVMIGDGELLEDCKKVVFEKNLENNILFTGFLDNPFSYVKNSKIALMPSKYEGLGMSAIECMCLGVPVLNSGNGGLKEIFKNHFEFICDDVDDYVQKILLLLNDENKYHVYQSRCMEIILPFIDMDYFISKINERYE